MTRLLEILISLAIVVALYLVVALVLPSKRQLVEKIETNRKLTIAFDSLNSVRRFKDWNPLVLRDPSMQLSFSGPESGVGARLDYVSTEESLGKGSWVISESVPRAVRSRTFALVYSLPVMIFGGSTQLVITWLLHVTGSSMAIAWYLTVVSLIGAGAMWAMRESAPIRLARAAVTRSPT